MGKYRGVQCSVQGEYFSNNNGINRAFNGPI